MAKKADAWKEYREAAVVDMVLATMPKVTSYIHKIKIQLQLFYSMDALDTVFHRVAGLLFVCRSSLASSFERPRWFT